MKNIAILIANEEDAFNWVESIKKKSDIKYSVINIALHDWFEKCIAKDFDMFLIRAPGNTNRIKQMFDDRISILVNEKKENIYPSLTEILIYENKKYFSYWLKVNNIPHPQTDVFYDKQDALNFIKYLKFPIIAKINIGASGKGVKILRDEKQAIHYISIAFSKGVKPYIGPNLRYASIFKKIQNAFKKKGLLQKRLKSYKEMFNEPQNYVIFQEFIQHDFEWRVVVIGDSYFAHKKVVCGDKASGSLLKNYGNPPLVLFDFIQQICIKTGIRSASFDVFETDKGFLINEIQTFFGQSDSFQMKVNNIIGRYRYINNIWVFEKGEFNTNQCYDLRLEHAMELLDN